MAQDLQHVARIITSELTEDSVFSRLRWGFTCSCGFTSTLVETIEDAMESAATHCLDGNRNSSLFAGRTPRKMSDHCLESCNRAYTGYCVCPDFSATEADADLICSDLAKNLGMHKPVIDIDHPCRLVESSPGKFHLYIDKEVAWVRYQSLLQSLVEAGIVEPGYEEASLARGYTAVRHPDRLKKPFADLSSSRE